MNLFLEIVKLQMLQSLRRRGFKGLVQFLMPELLAGIIVAFALKSDLSGLRNGFMFEVVFSTTLFVLLTESRKIFLVESDTEGFYFSPPTFQYHVAILISLVIISILVTIAIAIAPILSKFNSPFILKIMVNSVVLAWLNSLNLFLALLILTAVTGRNYVRPFLLTLQLLSGIALLVVIESAGRKGQLFMNVSYTPVTIAILLFLFVYFVFSSTIEKISDGLSTKKIHNSYVIDRVASLIKRTFFLRKGDEFSGFLFMSANFLRDQVLRLTVVGVIAMPYVATLYSLVFNQGVFVNFASMIKPMISVIAVGIFSYYFLSQSIAVSSNSEGKWLFQIIPSLDAHAFISGCRKSSVLFIHLPITLLIFIAALGVYPPDYAFLFVLTFHSFAYTSLSWFYTFQRNFPLSVPFKTMGASSITNLLFAFAYSFFVILTLLEYVHRATELLVLDVSMIVIVAIMNLILPLVLKRQRLLDYRLTGELR